MLRALAHVYPQASSTCYLFHKHVSANYRRVYCADCYLLAFLLGTEGSRRVLKFFQRVKCVFKACLKEDADAE